MVLFFSGADPTTSEGGGESARDIPVDVPCSDIVGVDGRLREIDDQDGCREVCFSTAAERVVERSVMVEAGAASVFGIIVVVSRRVLGRPAEAPSGDIVVLAVGVLGSDSIVVGVPTMFCGRTCGLDFEGDGPTLGFCDSAAEMSSFLGGGTTSASDGDCLFIFTTVSGLDALGVSKGSFTVSSAREDWTCGRPELPSDVFITAATSTSTLSSAVVLSLPFFGTKTFLESSSGF